ncbi:MAG: GntR family transcriptional regulator [Lachnospiraceae bacterium]|nr:GntR family transcriptional regulator [Lachnospiraceae bacterium]
MKILQNSNIPIYQQIATQLQEDILSGKLKNGEFLPSIRGLAKDLRISVITTIKAYEELERQGLVTAMQGKGYYVDAQNGEILREQQLRKMEEHLQNALISARLAGINMDDFIATVHILMDAEEQ